MLYLAIPAHNEVATIGVLLWRLRTVLAEFPREYEVVVYDDASTDETAAVAEQYVHAMPVTVLRGTKSIGYAGAVNALVRHIAAHTRYPRRDAMLLLQGDFTDPPGIVPEFARRFEGGADVVVGERSVVADAPTPVRRLFSASGWALRPFVRVEGVRDLTGSMRLMRISALRDLLRTVGDDAVCEGDSWTANADLLLRLIPHARRVETVPVEPTYGVRTRDTRRVTVRDALAALRWGWSARGRRAVPTSVPETGTETSARSARPAGSSRRRDEPEVTADRLRERSRDRERLRGEVDGALSRRDSRPERERRDGARPAQTEEQKAERRERKRNEKSGEKSGEKANEKRSDTRNGKRGEKREHTADEKPVLAREERAVEPRAARPPRAERQGRRGRSTSVEADAELFLDDPFAAPASRAVAGPSPSAPLPSASPSPSEADAVEADGERSPYAAEPTPPRAPDVTPDDTSADGPDDGLDDDTADAEGAADTGDDATPEARERKRRRNRRSRRRRSKQRGDAVEGSAEAAAPVGSEDADVSDDGDDADVASDDDSVSDSASDSVGTEGEGGDDKDHAARARRRGRRGRRGGSRRTRGRGREGAESDGHSPAGDGPSSPPSAPPSSTSSGDE